MADAPTRVLGARRGGADRRRRERLSAGRQYRSATTCHRSLVHRYRDAGVWFGLILIQTFAVWPKTVRAQRAAPVLHRVALPGETGALDYIRHLVLPVAALMIALVASWSRFGRAAMLDALSSDYVRTAQAKGVRDHRSSGGTRCATALAPLVTVVALDAAILIGGLVVTGIFAIPGMGRLSCSRWSPVTCSCCCRGWSWSRSRWSSGT
ncbi:ABC transporter permease subunit [Vibrio alginolyticus]